MNSSTLDHLRVGDRDGKVFLDKPLQDPQEKVDDLRIDADKEQDHQTDRHPFIIVEQVVREKEQRDQKQKCSSEKRTDILKEKADRHFADQHSAFFIQRHTCQQHKNLSRNIFSRNRIQIRCDRLEILNRTLVQFRDVVP